MEKCYRRAMMVSLKRCAPSMLNLVSLADVMAVNGFGDVCKLRTQDPENFDEEVKSLLSA